MKTNKRTETADTLVMCASEINGLQETPVAALAETGTLHTQCFPAWQLVFSNLSQRTGLLTPAVNTKQESRLNEILSY
jgi:hypothetical protein